MFRRRLNFRSQVAVMDAKCRSGARVHHRLSTMIAMGGVETNIRVVLWIIAGLEVSTSDPYDVLSLIILRCPSAELSKSC